MDKIAEKKKEMRLKAWTEMYAEYQVSGMMRPEGRKIITSDDVFDYMLDLRALNKGIDNKREELIKKYSKDFDGNLTDAEAMKLIGIANNTYYKYKREMREVLNNN